MGFEQVELGTFLHARQLASCVLKEQLGERYRINRDLSLPEALALQASAYLIDASNTDSMYGLQVVRLTTLTSQSVSAILDRFENRDRVFDSEWETQERATSRNKPARRMYTPTSLGRTVLGFFKPSSDLAE